MTISANDHPPIVVLASHPLHGFSMNRYSDLLTEGYRRAGFAVRVLKPTSILSRRLRPGHLRKMVIYVESLVLFGLRLLCHRIRGSVVHVADHSDALWLCLPLRSRSTVVTCHDLFAVRAARQEIPEHSTRLSGRIYQALVCAGLRRSDLVLAVSEATRNDVERLFPGASVEVVHNPLAPSLDPAESGVVAPNIAAPYILIVSSVGWRKRREHAIKVWMQMEAVSTQKLDLVIVGPQLSAEERSMADKTSPGEVRIITNVGDGELMGLYAEALAVVQVSRYEGFGWPVIEANIHGTPAICADLPVLREIGPCNLFISDSLEGVDWRNALEELQSLNMRRAVLEYAQRYRMDHFADELAKTVGRAGW